jgi:hypothetical protein
MDVMVPSFVFYDDGRLGHANVHENFQIGFAPTRFDPETSEYLFEHPNYPDYVEVGRARLIPGTPRKLLFSGSYITFSEPWAGGKRPDKVRAQYNFELAREADARSMRAPSVPGGCTVEPYLPWMKGTWVTQSGDPLIAGFFDNESIYETFYDDDGYKMMNTAHVGSDLLWVEDEKAFLMCSIERTSRSRRLNHSYGWLRPSAGSKDAPSETMEYVGIHSFTFDSGNEHRTHRAVLVKAHPELLEHYQKPKKFGDEFILR